jgi:hypothetical protein
MQDEKNNKTVFSLEAAKQNGLPGSGANRNLKDVTKQNSSDSKPF